MTVVTAFELDDLLAARVRAGHPDRAHRRFCAGAHETNAFDRRHHRSNELPELDFELGGGAEACPMSSCSAYRFDESGGCVAMDERPPRHHVIDVCTAVDIGDVGTRCTSNEKRRSADRFESAYGAADAAGEDLLGAREELR